MTTSRRRGIERIYLIEHPDMGDTFGQVLVIADGETAEEAEVRARHIGQAVANGAAPVIVHQGAYDPAAPDAYKQYNPIDLRGLPRYVSEEWEWNILLPSWHALLERVNFHPTGGTSVYRPVGISQGDPLWLVQELEEPEQWLVFPIDARSFSREEAIATVDGSVDLLRCTLLEMGSQLSPHEKEQLREIRAQR